jgi:hypothetical protein
MPYQVSSTIVTILDIIIKQSEENHYNKLIYNLANVRQVTYKEVAKASETFKTDLKFLPYLVWRDALTKQTEYFLFFFFSSSLPLYLYLSSSTSLPIYLSSSTSIPLYLSTSLFLSTSTSCFSYSFCPFFPLS